MTSRYGVRFERREGASRFWQYLAMAVAVAASLAVFAILVVGAGADIGEAFAALYAGAFGSWKASVETLLKATPLILTGLSITVAFRGKIFNVAAEGQLIAGAMAAYWVGANLTMPRTTLFVAMLAAAFSGGAVCGWIPGFLKAKYGVNEIIVTVLFNYIMYYLFSFMLSGPWQQPGQYYLMSPELPENAQFPIIVAGSRLHAGFLVAIAIVPLVYLLLQKSRLGYEIRAIGANPTAAKFKGIDVEKVIVITMMISGGIAGLAGAGEVAGLQHRLRGEISAKYGFTGIIIAMLAGLNPVSVVPAAVLFGGIANGSNRMQIATGVPNGVVYAIQAAVLLLFLGSQVIAANRIRITRHVD